MCAPTLRSQEMMRVAKHKAQSTRKTTSALVSLPLRSMTWLSPKPQPTPQGQASLRWVPEQRLSPQGHCQAARSTEGSSKGQGHQGPLSTHASQTASRPVLPFHRPHAWLYLTLASHHRNDCWGAAGAGPASQLTWQTGPCGGWGVGRQTDKLTDSRSSETLVGQKKANNHTCPGAW